MCVKGDFISSGGRTQLPYTTDLTASLLYSLYLAAALQSDISIAFVSISGSVSPQLEDPRTTITAVKSVSFPSFYLNEFAGCNTRPHR